MKDHVHPQPDVTDAPELMRSAVDHGARLVRNEIEFAKREVTAGVTRALIGVVMMLTALLLVFTVLDILAAAAIAAIAAAGIPVAWASLIVGGVAIVIAAGLFLAGKARLNPKNLTPQRTMKHLRRDAETIKETVNV